MPTYKAPVRDMRFLMNEVLDFESHYKTFPEGEEATPDMVEAIIGEMAKLCENTLAPLYQSGDEEGCKFENGVVTTPKGYKEAYDEFVAGGWQGLSHPVEFGGQGLPASLGLIKSEMMATANWSFTMYPGLSMGAMNTIQMHGSDQQLQDYLVPLTEGRWGGTMCLTEPQCGTDLGQVKTKAEPQKDGSYKISGTKIFISSGEHDLTENIVHIVLARLPDAPKGTKGISLFIGQGALVGQLGVGQTLDGGADTRGVHEGEHALQALVLRADQETGGFIKVHHAGGGGLDAHFLFQGTTVYAVVFTDLARQVLGHDEQ